MMGDGLQYEKLYAIAFTTSVDTCSGTYPDSHACT